MLIIVNIIVNILDLDSVIQCLYMYLIDNLQESPINLFEFIAQSMSKNRWQKIKWKLFLFKNYPASFEV